MKTIRDMSEEEFIRLYEEFTDKIVDDGYLIMPSKANFANFIGTTKSDVIYWYKQHTHAQDVINQMTADVVIEGMANRKYQTSAGSFALKNWCKWSDNPAKPEQKAQTTSNTLLSEKEAAKKVDDYKNDFEYRRKMITIANRKEG